VSECEALWLCEARSIENQTATEVNRLSPPAEALHHHNLLKGWLGQTLLRYRSAKIYGYFFYYFRQKLNVLEASLGHV